MAQSQLVIQEQQCPSPSPLDLDIEREIKRIRMGGPLLLTDRDDLLEEWLDEQRESGNSGFVCSVKGSGISDYCQFYQMKHVKRKGVIQQLPVSVVYSRIPPICSLDNFYTVVLEALNHPIITGKIKDKRSRIRGRLKDYETRLLIIDDAEYLTYEAFCELAQIYDMLKIPTILIGTHNLKTILRTRNWHRVFNSFLESYEYLPMTQEEMKEVIDSWETDFLKWPEESDFLNSDLLPKIHQKTGGLKDALDGVLRKAAIKTLKQGSFKITATTIQSVLDQRVKPQLELQKVKEP